MMMMMMEGIATSPTEIRRSKKCFLCDSPAVDGNCSLGPYFRTTRRSEPLSVVVGENGASDGASLWGTFILTELLKMPEEDSQEMLGGGGADDDDGGQWLEQLCGPCVQFVSEFRNRYEERVEIDRRMEGMRRVALGKLLGLPLGDEEAEQQEVGVVEECSTAGVRQRICGYFRGGGGFDTDASNDATPTPSASTSSQGNYARDVAVEVSSRLGAASKPVPKKGNRNENEKCSDDDDEDVEEPGPGSSKGTTRSQQKMQEMEKTRRRRRDRNKSQSDSESSSNECVFCGKLCTSTASLNSHIRRHIGEEGPIIGFVGVRRSRADMVADDAAEEEVAVGPVAKPKKHCCTQCGKSFKSKSLLTQHLSVHTGERPWACEICDKRFARKGDLTQHLKTHSHERPHVCNMCDKRFRFSHHLKDHILTHTGEKFKVCIFCGKGFSQSSHLSQHIRVHIQERPCFCRTCNKEFSDPSVLNCHIWRIHKNHKAWTCEICSKKFGSSSHLNSHICEFTQKKDLTGAGNLARRTRS